VANKILFDQLKKLSTEQQNPNTRSIDLADSLDIVKMINNEDALVADAVKTKLPEIARAVDLAKSTIESNGRVFYFGAGSSGRLGVLDAAECPPTFGTTPDTFQGFIAGGKEAMFRAQEGAEDKEETGADDFEKAWIQSKDLVIGLAASGRTPYVHGALKAAKSKGCKTVLIVTVPSPQVTVSTDILIDVPVGPEVIMGSTRMKSATAQKMVLNMISTGAMIRLGKVYENVMVDLQLTNKKLKERAIRIIMYFTGKNYEEADKLLNKSDNHVKTAIVMALSDSSKEESIKLLRDNEGFIRRIKGIQK
jgi:N-acetylmuramic acid 6-phosphate etherase